ncbi:MAG: FKBP-type peptidyl-prolyl cis-trans isomerase [Chlorobi bacterium]|nr:FKBP-type peptidyl-prolyl cis-trans isomerase [Chlorobiota bacterium]
MKRFVFTLFVTIAVLISSCNDDEVTKQPEFRKRRIDDTLLKVNRFLPERDSELIRSYVDRHGLNMQVSDEGLWYSITSETKGRKIKEGDIVSYDYRIELLDGTLCYSSDSSGTAQIKIGKSGKETGLEKGLLMMRKGEKAKFILPPHLGYGLLGDMKRIPARSVLVYDIEVKDVTDF